MTQIVAGCGVSSNGAQTVLSVGLTAFEDKAPLRIHEKDAAMTHDASGERLLAPYDAFTKYVGGDLTLTMGYSATIPGDTKPTLGFRIDNRKIAWMDLPLPVAPTLEVVEGPPRVLRWAPSAAGELRIFAACEGARAPSERPEYAVAPERSEGGPTRVPLDAGAASIDVSKIEDLLAHGRPDACRSISVVAVRFATIPAADLGLHASSSCSVEQARSITFNRTTEAPHASE